jgi:phytoene dehydrogenase-like protein
VSAAAHDVIVVGAGHNGLIAAFGLAKAGLKPLVLERRDRIGGALATSDIHPGFRCPALAHALPPWPPALVRELGLDRRGVELLHGEPRLFAPGDDGRYLVLYGDAERSAQGIAGLSAADARVYPEFQRALTRIGSFLSALLARTPPNVDRLGADWWTLLQTARGFRALGRTDGYRLLRWMPMPVADLATEWFETDLLSAVVAARGVFGTRLGPRAAGTAAIFLLNAAVDPCPAGPATFVRGGFDRLADALAAAARDAGAEIRTSADVRRVSVTDGVATGVTLADGTELGARAVVASADPRHVLLDLVDPVHFEPAFLNRARNIRGTGTLAKVNLAVDRLPAFTALAPLAEQARRAALSGRIHIGPGVNYIERAFDAAKYGGFSDEPYLDVTIPSLADPSLAPEGAHVISICAQWAPYDLKAGSWDSVGGTFGQAVVRTLAKYAPGFESSIVAQHIITPLDLERTYGFVRGHIYQGEPALDQLFVSRPVFGWSRYATPVRNLFVCGVGTHPGIGASALSGLSASREVLRALK